MNNNTLDQVVAATERFQRARLEFLAAEDALRQLIGAGPAPKVASFASPKVPAVSVGKPVSERVLETVQAAGAAGIGFTEMCAQLGPVSKMAVKATLKRQRAKGAIRLNEKNKRYIWTAPKK